MKRVLLPLLAALTLPTAVNANVNPKVNEKCLKANDYEGCVKVQKAEEKKKMEKMFRPVVEKIIIDSTLLGKTELLCKLREKNYITLFQQAEMLKDAIKSHKRMSNGNEKEVTESQNRVFFNVLNKYPDCLKTPEKD
tara:strand:- start:194 stop:604 length:411 start_codon:yes stop_codon:yes gene_type:complete